MAKPNAVALIGTCPFCQETVEFPLTKKQVKRLLKGFKRSARANVVGVKAECPRCKKPVEVLASKNDLKAIYMGFREESTAEAELAAEKHRRRRRL